MGKGQTNCSTAREQACVWGGRGVRDSGASVPTGAAGSASEDAAEAAAMTERLLLLM